MDGLLIDTEPIWRRAEVEVFGALGMQPTETELLAHMGVRIGEVVRLWYERHPWEGPSVEEVAQAIEDHVVDHVLEEGEPNPGVCRALELVHAARLPMAVASSSSERLIRAVILRLRIGEYIRVICSADSEPEGKPHPGVYLTTAARLGVSPEACIAFEDSPNGVLSAKAAGMFCVAVPDRNLARDPRMTRADRRLSSLEELTPDLLQQLLNRPV